MTNPKDSDRCVEVLTRCGPFSRTSGQLYVEGLNDGERQELLKLHAALAAIEERTAAGIPAAQRLKPDEARQQLRVIGERFTKLTDGVADRRRAERAVKVAPLVGTGEP